MDHRELAQRVAGCTAEQSFVMLWSFVRANLRSVNRDVRRTDTHPASLEPADLNLPINELPGQVATGNVTVARWLKRLDLQLSDASRRGDQANASPVAYSGIDDLDYLVRARNIWADDPASQTNDDDETAGGYGDSLQGGMSAYCRHVVAVPARLDHDLTLREVELPAALRRKLKQRIHERQLVALLWPTWLGPLLSAIQDIPPWLSVRPEPPDSIDVALIEQLDLAIAHARHVDATILVLPEVCCSPGGLEHLKRQLHELPGPLLSVVGLFHAPDPTSGLEVNEAVVLDASGNELFRHQKTAPFGTNDGSGHAQGERLAEGDTVTIMATPIGNLTVAICAELFAAATKPALLASHASLVVSPSFSPQTNPHLAAAAELDATNAAMTLCTNTWATGPSPAAGPSFGRAARTTRSAPPGTPSFEIDLCAFDR